jgi:hypothetical protein
MTPDLVFPLKQEGFTNWVESRAESKHKVEEGDCKERGFRGELWGLDEGKDFTRLSY